MKKILLVLLVFFTILKLINFEQLRVNILTELIISRGVITIDCFWYKITELFFKDSSGINLFNDFKKKYGDFAFTNVFGKDCYLVTNINDIKFILNNSPNLFNVGELKLKFFKTFMEKNVGVSGGCPWKRRRAINDYALETDKIHKYSSIYNDHMHYLVNNLKDKISFNDLASIGKNNVYKIVFNSTEVHDDVFKIFKLSNNTKVFKENKFNVNKNVYQNYKNTLNKFINNPKKESLIELCLEASHDKEEVYHQIPHFIFPIFGLFLTTMPRLLILLCSHPDIFQKVIDETNKNDVYNLTFLRKCIMETLRLNSPVISLFRTIEKDIKLKKRNFKKGTQLLLLTNPILRQQDNFPEAYKFKPERWNEKLEKEYYSISFSQGPQKCPGKELAIFLVQSFVYNLIKIKKIGITKILKSNKKIDINNIPQVINTCDVVFTLKNI